MYLEPGKYRLELNLESGNVLNTRRSYSVRMGMISFLSSYIDEEISYHSEDTQIRAVMNIGEDGRHAYEIFDGRFISSTESSYAQRTFFPCEDMNDEINSWILGITRVILSGKPYNCRMHYSVKDDKYLIVDYLNNHIKRIAEESKPKISWWRRLFK